MGDQTIEVSWQSKVWINRMKNTDGPCRDLRVDMIMLGKKDPMDKAVMRDMILTFDEAFKAGCVTPHQPLQAAR